MDSFNDKSKNNGKRIPIILSNNVVIFPSSVITAEIINSNQIPTLENLLLRNSSNDHSSSILAVFPSADETYIQDSDKSVIIKGILWFYRGCLAEIIEISKSKVILNNTLDTVKYNIVLKGLRKCELLPNFIEISQSNDLSTSMVKEFSYDSAPISDLKNAMEKINEVEKLLKILKFLFSTGLLQKSLSADKIIKGILENERNDIESLCDVLATVIPSFHSEKLKILSSNSLKDLIESVYGLLTAFFTKIFRMDGTLVINRILNDVDSNVHPSSLFNQNRKSSSNFLISKELDILPKNVKSRGNIGFDEDDDEIEILKSTAYNMELPEQVRKIIDKELKRLKKMSSTFPEYTVSKTYIETLLDVPWFNKTNAVEVTIEKAREILNLEHYGLNDIKNRIYEYIAVMILNNKMNNDLKQSNSVSKSVGLPTILCFTGPPGVGKTSLGRSIANALGRKFERISLGGVSDEAELRGHRRTYVGAIPGVLIQALRRCGSKNPVILLDEIDKISQVGSRGGDPSAALLEILDPDQNSTYIDHYLATPFDLSEVIFIATANRLELLSSPLRDRMEIIQLSGYTIDEKLIIASKYLISKQLKSCCLTNNSIELSSDVIEFIINKYTNEAGVRQLDKKLGSICRYIAMKMVEGKLEETTNIINVKNIIDILGSPIFEKEMSANNKIPGRSTGLAWTPTGGEILFIECVYINPSIGKLTITGNMGDVMQESCSIALSWIKHNYNFISQTYGSDDDSLLTFDKLMKSDIHIHVPAGAIAKDGPSAGCAITIAMVSSFLNIPIDNRLAMTGEITLLGDVLPVGGIKEKVLAAKQAGITTIVLPQRNKKDFDKINDTKLLENMKVHYVNHIHDILKITFKTNKYNPITRLSTSIPYFNQEIIGTVMTKPSESNSSSILLSNSKPYLKSLL